MANRSVSFYIVLRRKRRWQEAVVIRKSSARPRLAAGECAVRVSLSVPDEAFDPVLQGPDLAFECGQVLRAPVTGKAVS